MTTKPSEPAFILTERLGVEWQGHPVSFLPGAEERLPAGTTVFIRNLTLDQRITGQVDSDGRVWFLADLPAYARYSYAAEPPEGGTPNLEHNQSSVQNPDFGRPSANAVRCPGFSRSSASSGADHATAVASVETDPVARKYRLTNGLVTLAVPQAHAEAAPGDALADVPAPLSWLAGPEGARRGRGLWAASIPVTSVHSEITAGGPVFAEVCLVYRFAGGHDYRITWRLYANAPVALATETKTVDGPGHWAFDLYPEFAPTMAQICWGQKGHWPLDYHADEHLCRHIFSNHWDLYQDFKEVSFLYRPEAGASGDAIGVFPVDGAHWEVVPRNIISLDVESAGPSVQYRFSLTPGRREFGLFAVPLKTTNHEAPEGTDGGGAYIFRNRWSFVRLNDVKDLVLEWEEPANTALTLYGSPERLAALTQKVRLHPEWYRDLAGTSALFSDDPAVAELRRKTFFDDLHRMRDNAVRFGPNGGNSNPVMNRPLLHIPLDYAILSRRGMLTPEDDRRARAIIAFLAYYTDREDYDFGRRSLLPAGHPEEIMTLYKGMRAENMTVDRWVGVGLVGAAFPGHPCAAAWRKSAVDAFNQSMDVLVADSGAWCEGWGYYRWSLHLLMGFAHAFRNAGIDVFVHPRFKAMLRFVVLALGPRNAAYAGKRITPTFGSYGESVDFSGCGFSYLMALAAAGYTESDPAFARELMWAYQEMGEGPMQTNVGLQAHDRELIALFSDFTRPGQEPVRASQGCPGFGAIFHHREADGRETRLVARASPYWPHGHADGGSFFLTARNAPLISEAARGVNREGLYTSMGSYAHNVITYDGKHTFHYVWPCRQNLVQFREGKGFDYAVLDCRVEQLVLGGERRRGHGDAITQAVDIRQYRHIIHVHPDLFVIYDSIANAPFPSSYRLHGYGREIRIEGNHTFLAGHHGVDLDVCVVLPTAPVLRTTAIGDTHSIEIENGPNQPYLVVLNPMEAGDSSPVQCDWTAQRLSIRRGNAAWSLQFVPSDTAGICNIE